MKSLMDINSLDKSGRQYPCSEKTKQWLARQIFQEISLRGYNVIFLINAELWVLLFVFILLFQGGKKNQKTKNQKKTQKTPNLLRVPFFFLSLRSLQHSRDLDGATVLLRLS